ncbi:MAG TPA: NAD(P)(+) transhydrogenase (Re/Si-specific) subunit beta, partial [Daejeonella sp.]|nr:NAD(P)(+) transhydrogenase (Re/Si-specific) subunit beta [Daejeonella sp.]
MELNILIICYLIGSVTFIIGLKMLSHPESARKGNLIAAAGMAVSILGTIFLYEEEGLKLGNYAWIFSALIIGTILGTMAAKRVKMTAMPEMVSLFNGMGGACAALISIVEFDHLSHQVQSGATADRGILLIIFAGLIIGTVSFSGSMVAWGKLNGKIKDFSFNGQHIVNLVIFGVIIALSAYLIISLDTAASTLFYVIFALSIVYGLFFVFPIGGADMPVVISLLNSFTGVAAAFGGFLYDNPVMLTGGILVGSAGTILTILMCKAMNRPLSNVLIGS